jgi:hypothetical protein
VVIAVGLVICYSVLVRAETQTVSRRPVRFDRKPAAGAKVLLLSDYGLVKPPARQEVIADADGLFSTDVTDGGAWTGHTIVKADGCALTCEVGVTGRPKSQPLAPVILLGVPFEFAGRMVDRDGRPLANAQVSLIWARPDSGNPIVFNSTTTAPTATPELTARSAADGTWSMPGIDFAGAQQPKAASAVFESVAEDPLRAALLEVKLSPNTGSRQRTNVPLDSTLTPLIRVEGTVVNSVTGKPVAGASLTRNVLYTTLPRVSALTDEAGRFELCIAGPLRVLWFHVYHANYPGITVETAMREQATSEWPDTRELTIRLRPSVEVSGKLEDENGHPSEEALEIRARYEEGICALWSQECHDGATKSGVAADGTFSARVPVGPITLGLRRPPQQMGPLVGIGLPSEEYILEEQVEIPPEGAKGLRLKASREGGVIGGLIPWSMPRLPVSGRMHAPLTRPEAEVSARDAR